MKQVKLISGVLFALLFSVALAGVTGLPAVLLFGGIVALSFAAQTPQLALFSAINTTELASALGDYYRENRDIMVTKLLLDPNVFDKFNVYDDVRDELPLPNLDITDIIKPGVVKTFAPTSNALNFGARILKVRDIKFDLLIQPTDLHKRWLAYNLNARRSDGSHDPYEIPFEAFIMDYISQSARNQLYLQGMFKGVYNAAGTTPAATMTGFASLVTSLIGSSAITPVSVADPTASNIITVVEATYDGLGEAYKNVPTQMFAAPNLFDFYVRKYRADFGGNMDFTGVARNRVAIDGTLCELVREPGLAGTSRLIAGPKENFAYGCDTGATATMDIQKFDRGLKILGDFKAGVQFQQLGGALSVNGLSTD